MNCLQSSNLVDVLFNNEITKNFVSFIGSDGTLELCEELAKPFFSICIRKKYTIKGALGNYKLRIYLGNDKTDDFLEEFRGKVELFTLSLL